MKNFELIKSKDIYSNQYCSFQEDIVKHPNGEERKYFVRKSLPAVAIIAINESKRILFIEEEKYLAGKKIVSVPIGAIETSQSVEQAANKELEEETGFKAGQLKNIGGFMMGTCQFEICHVFVASKISKVHGKVKLGTPDEIIGRVLWLTEKEVWQMVGDGKIDSGLVMSCLMKFFSGINYKSNSTVYGN
jgi:8-oxo-dGTP pyrophosphatase MutT (NUDIX family)